MSDHDAYTSKRYKEDWEDALVKLTECERQLAEAQAEIARYSHVREVIENTISEADVLVAYHKGRAENAEAEIERMRPVICSKEFIRPEVLAFAKAMEIKLRENDYKEHWSKSEIGWLIQRASEELDELSECKFWKSQAQLVLSEAADVANFCMMIADNVQPVIETMRDYEAKEKL